MYWFCVPFFDNEKKTTLENTGWKNRTRRKMLDYPFDDCVLSPFLLAACVMKMTERNKIFVLVLLLAIGSIQCSFWNEIPARCIYDRTRRFACSNTTFVHTIPLFTDRSYEMEEHHVDIQDCVFQLPLRDLLSRVGTSIENLTLSNNSFSLSALESGLIFEGGLFFRLLISLDVHDESGLQWSQLNGSYFPQLIKLDLSNNRWTNESHLVFDRKFYPRLTVLNLSHNRLTTIDRLIGNALHRVETLILSFNPLESIADRISQFQFLTVLDLSSTPIKQLFSLTLVPRLQTLRCQLCRQIPSWEYEKFLGNCSEMNVHHLQLDFTEANIDSLKSFNPSMGCIKSLILNRQNLVGSITTGDLLQSTHLERIEARENYAIDYIYLNVYDHLLSIDFSENIYLKQVILRLKSDSTHLQRLSLSNTALDSFSIDFFNRTAKYVHIDVIDMSHGRLETLEFLQYLTFHSLDLSYNLLKIVDIDSIHFRHGMYNLALMNLLNLSSNGMEFVNITWENESPHALDLTDNKLETLELHGQTTYSVHLAKNPKLSVSPATMQLDLPGLKYLDLTDVQLDSFETLNYLHNLSNIRTLILDDNRLSKGHRTLNWHTFSPWHQYLTHLSLRNMSLNHIEAGARLNDFYHLLTVDFSANVHLNCDCDLHPFVRWLKTPPPPLADFEEPLEKVFRVDCPVSLFSLPCDVDDDVDNRSEGRPRHSPLLGHVTWLRTFFILMVFASILFAVYQMANRRLRYLRSRFYQRVHTDGDIITLNERHITHKTPGDWSAIEHM